MPVLIHKVLKPSHLDIRKNEGIMYMKVSWKTKIYRIESHLIINSGSFLVVIIITLKVKLVVL